MAQGPLKEDNTMDETALLEGRRFRIFAKGKLNCRTPITRFLEVSDWVTAGSLVYWRWLGEIEVTSLETGEVLVANFETLEFSCGGYGASLQKGLMIYKGRKWYASLGDLDIVAEAANPMEIIDRFGELVSEAIRAEKAKEGTIIPGVLLPTLSLDELEERGWIAEPTGQITLGFVG